MPKKPQQQAESNSHALSREDRKNEQICRMIERAEKLRLKKEQKKKLADINKASGKVGGGGATSRKQKKPGLLSTKRTQIAIRILFNESVRAQNISNRYFFERKQTIEEKQRMEQEEMWSRYTMRVQQQQQQQLAQQQVAMGSSQVLNTGHCERGPQLHMLPALHDNLSYNHSVQQQPPQQQIYTGATNYTQVHGNGPPVAPQLNNRCNPMPLYQNVVAPQQPSGVSHMGGQQQPQVVSASSEQRFYMNDGATGGHYEAVNEDQSGSSYFSSASKRAMQQQQPTSTAQQEQNVARQQVAQAQAQHPALPQMSFATGGGAPGLGASAPLQTTVSEPVGVVGMQQLKMNSQQQQSLGSVLNSLHQQKSDEEEKFVGMQQVPAGKGVKKVVALAEPEPAAAHPSIRIDVDLKAGTANVVAKSDNDDKGIPKRKIQQPNGSSLAELPTGVTIRSSSQIEGVSSVADQKKMEQQRILELTRQQMQQKRSSPSK